MFAFHWRHESVSGYFLLLFFSVLLGITLDHSSSKDSYQLSIMPRVLEASSGLNQTAGASFVYIGKEKSNSIRPAYDNGQSASFISLSVIK